MAYTTYDRRPGHVSQKIARILYTAKIANTHEIAEIAYGENPSDAQIKTTWQALAALRKKRLVVHENGPRGGPRYGSGAMVWWLSPVGLTYVKHGWHLARRQLRKVQRA